MSQTFQHHGQLADACAEWAKISLNGLQPRRNLHLSDKKADWKEALSALKRFAAEPGADVAFWTPAALLSRLAAANETFN